MKIVTRTLLVGSVVAISLTVSNAEAGFFSKIVKAISHLPGIGDVVEHYADKKAHRKVDKKINRLYESALACSTQEHDGDFSVRDLMKMKPAYPGWEKLEKFEKVSKSASARAEDFSKDDKIRHCYAGCLISRELGRAAGTLAAFSKELKDASDCSLSTHFELQDYEATVAGAIAGQKLSCETFCGITAVGLNGSGLLREARELTSRSAGSPQRTRLRTMVQ